MHFNRMTAIGNLTRNPEVRYTPSGTPVATFGLAVNRRFKQGEDLKEEVMFIDVVVFGRTAENCSQHLVKGQQVLIEGRLQQRRWETEDGQKRSKHEIVAENVQFGAKPGQHSNGQQPTQEEEPQYEHS